MNEIVDFIVNYWWLGLVIAGVAGGSLEWLQRLAKQRHKRRLEVIKATTELRAVRMDDDAEPRALTRPSPMPDQLAKIFAAHDAVTARWLDYELDVAKLTDYSAMSDGRNDLTAALLRAKKVADELRPASVDAKITPAQVAEYRAAVAGFEVAFERAEHALRSDHP